MPNTVAPMGIPVDKRSSHFGGIGRQMCDLKRWLGYSDCNAYIGRMRQHTAVKRATAREAVHIEQLKSESLHKAPSQMA